MKAICFVCGSKGANSILHVKPRGKGAYFSFLESHDPPKGAKLPNGEGVVSACLVCYAFLNQQWDSFERSKTPLVKRLYWLKRVDNRSFTGAELNVQGEYVAQIMGVQYNCGLSGNISPFDYGSHTGISCSIKDALPSPSNDSNLSPSIDNPVERGELNGVLDLSVSPKKPKAHSRRSQKSEDVSVANASKALGTSGSKVLSTNSSKTLSCDSVSNAKQKNVSIVCYVCCKTCPASLARFVYAIKYSDDEPYFPFILGLAEPSGAMVLTKNGVTQVCSECRKTLSRQWRIFESRKVAEMDRVYKINDAPIVVEKTTKENGDGGDACVAARNGGSACYLCGEITLLSSMYTLKTREEEAEVETSRIVLPFIEKLKCPLGARPIDSRGIVLVCGLCHDHIRCQWQKFEENNLPVDRREYMLRPFLNANNSLAFPANIERINPMESMATEKKNLRRTQFLRDAETPSNTGKESVEFAKDPLHPFLLDRCLSDGSRRTITAFPADAASFRMPFPSPLLLKMDCNKNMMTKTDATTPAEALTCNGHNSSAKEQNQLQSDNIVHTRCFLCRSKCKKLRSNWKSCFVSIYDRPDIARSSEDSKTCFVRPFFPFLSTVTPSAGVEVSSDDGRFDVCYVCYHNLIGQWFAFEKSKDLEEQNRWLRKYRFRSFLCSICKQSSDRQKMEIVMVEESPLVLGSADGLVSIEGSDCGLVCSSCLERLRLNGEQNGRKSGKTLKRSSGVKWPKTIGELAKLDPRDEHRQTKTSSNSSSSSSSLAAAAKEGDKQQSFSSSSSSSTSSPTDIKTMTGEMSSAVAAAAESGEAVCKKRRREQSRKEEEETAPQPPPLPSQHLFPGAAAAAATSVSASVASSSSSSSNSYLEALRRMTIDSCNRTTSGASSSSTTNSCLTHTHDLVKRLDTGTNESPSEVKLVSKSIKDSNHSTENKSMIDDEFAQRKFHQMDEINKKSDRWSCNGLLSSVAAKEEEEEEEDSVMIESNPSNNSSSIRRRRCSSRTNSSSTKTEDVFSSSSTLKKTKSPSRSGGTFPSSPLPPPPPVAASDASSGHRLGYNGFIPPQPPAPSSSDRMLNPIPFHPSLIRHPPHPPQLLSSSSSSSFMSQDALYLPQLIGSSSSVFNFLPPHPPLPPMPSSSSALRWEDYLVMQKLQQQHQQQMMSPSSSSFLPYSSTIFPHPSLIHPLLQPNAIPSPFLYASDRSSASIGLPSAFDLSDVLRRDIYKRSHGSPSDSSEMESIGYWKSGAPLRRNNGYSGPEEEEEEEDGERTSGNDLLRVRQGHHGKDSAVKDGRSQGDGKTTERQRKDTKPNFHRPFLENCSADEGDDYEEEEEELEVERTDPDPPHPPLKDNLTSAGNNEPVKDDIDVTYESVFKTEGYSDRMTTSPSISSNALIETNRSRLIAELNGHPKNGHLVTITQPKLLDGLSTNGFTDVVRYGSSHLSKEELLNAALSLISLQSPRVLSLAKRTSEQRQTTTALDNESNDNGSRCHRSMNNDELSSEETNTCKRLRLDVDDHLTTTTTSSKPTNNSNCATRHNIERKQSLPVDRLLSSPPPPSKPPDLEEKIPPCHISSSSSSSSSPLPAPDDHHQPTTFRLRWPGIEAIIESYQQHCQDFASEREFLFDEGLRNARSRRELLSSSETFSAKIVELTRMQQDLERDRDQLQSFVDNLTCCLRQLQ